MMFCNHTGSSVEITWCYEDHWSEHGDHEPGDYESCKSRTVSIQDGSYFSFDESDDNGDHIKSKCIALGMTQC